MKKIIFFLTCYMLLFVFSTNAQPKEIPDGNFETGWIKLQGCTVSDWYQEYRTSLFYTLNSLSVVCPSMGHGDETAFKDPNGVHGVCIKLKSGRVTLGTGEPYFLPGMVGTISEDFVGEFLNPPYIVHITRDWDEYDTPHALIGYYKYLPVQGDSALIDIGFSSKGVGFVESKIIKEEVKDWTKFIIEIPEQYRGNFYKDIRLLFVASAGVNFNALLECQGQQGSTLWIDDISLCYSNCELGIKESLFSTLKAKAFPNPTTNLLNLELNEHFIGKVVVYNSLGSLVMEENINGTQCQLNTSALSTGNYIYKLMNDNTIFARGKFVVVR